MPELPEVETVRLQLLHTVVGKTITRVDVFHQKTVGYDANIRRILQGTTIEHIDRVGKLLIFSFVGEPDMYLLAHLKMTGQFFYVKNQTVKNGGGHTMTASDIAQFPGRHTRVAFHFSDGASLFFNDMRLFGYIKCAHKDTVTAVRAGFGPEPIDQTFDCDWFVRELRKRKTCVKAALLNQQFVAGLGNIYADEALWRAGIRPTRKGCDVSKSNARALCLAAGAVMRESIELGGTTFQHFMDTTGQRGNFKQHLKVFGRQGEQCERCGATIKKIRCAARGTHYCPGCQK